MLNKKMKTIKFSLYLLVSIIGLNTGYAQMNSHSYKSELKGVKANWHSLQLPKDYFENCKKDFSDIRIYGITATDTIEAPYVLNTLRSVNPLSANQKAFSIVNKVTGENGYSVTLENSDRKSLNKIQLAINDSNYDYTVEIEGSNDQLKWLSVNDSIRVLRIKNKHIDFNHSHLNFDPINFPFIKLTFKNSKKVNLQNVSFTEFAEIKEHYIKHKLSYTTKEDKKLKQTIIHVKLPYKTPVTKVALVIESQFDYYRTMRIEALQDSVVAEKGVLYNYKNLHHQNISSFKNTYQDFGNQNKNDFVQQLKITISNHDNTPLLIKGVEVQSNPIEISARFDNFNAKYYLVSGNEKSQKPNYDIVNFTKQIPKELAELKVGKVQYIKINNEDKKQLKESFFTNKLLWAVLLVIIIFLGYFTYKMLKED